jgi:RNA polymerase sigma factor (sigma-70 family)
MCDKNLTDFELVEQFIEGKQSSLEILIQRHKSRVYTYIYLLVKNHQLAEDIFQDTFIKVINSLREGKYQDKGRFVSWVVRIAHNLIIDHFRREKNLNTVSNDQYDFDLLNSSKLTDRNIEDHLIHDQVTNDIRALIEELPAEQKEVVILRHYMGLSFKEIAENTGVSINTALGRMRYALINMRKLIKEKDIHLILS